MAVDENGTQVVTWELSFTDTTRRVMEAIDKEYGRNLEVVESFNGHLIVRDWYAQNYLHRNIISPTKASP